MKQAGFIHVNYKVLQWEGKGIGVIVSAKQLAMTFFSANIEEK